MAAADVEKVLKLKHQLKGCCEGPTVLKILKKLQKLDITLDVLAETGIGKVVNSYRKHDQAGKVAKMLVIRWKALVPKDSAEQSKDSSSSKQTSREVEQRRGSHLSESINSRKKTSDNVGGKPSWNIDVESEVNLSKHKTYFDKKKKKEKKKLVLNQSLQTCSLAGTEHINQESKKTAKIFGVTRKQQSTKMAKLTTSKSAAGQREKKGDSCRKDSSNKTKEKLEKMENQDCLKKPSMPFEAYLSYDLEPLKRRKCFSAVTNPKRLKIHKENSQVQESCVKSTEAVMDPLTTAPEQSVMDFLNVPLPTSFPECKDVSQYQYFNDRKAERKVIDAYKETPIFVGQRLKNKIQVYSGSKITYLPTMLTLYQQCIRALQNNIDSLYEIGRVPFEIFEPVLDRCTPEQLLRIEEHNPVYIGVTDHLWEKHCQKDFRNAQLQEYESWRELYLRMSEERERKLKQLTKSIVTAHSGKPKGRQVKMAFIHSAAKPPRNVRIQQEIHGTAGSVTLLHLTDKPSSVKTYESCGRSNFSETPKPSNSSGQTQDLRKNKRMAPMMAKSLKAFKKQLSRR